MKTWLVLIAAWLVCGSARAEEPLRIVTIFAKTGTLSNGATAVELEPGARFAIAEINAAGGLAGRKLELIELDSKSTPLGAREAAIEAMRLRPLAVIGERVSSLSLAIAPVLQKAGIVMISPNSTHPDVTRAGNYIFRLSYLNEAQGAGLARFAREHLHAARAAVLTNVSQKYSEELARHFSSRFAALGGAVVLQDEYVQDASDFGAQLGRVKRSGADLLFVPGYARDAGLIVRQARQLGIKTAILGGDAWGASVGAYAGVALDGSYRSAHWSRDDPSPASRQFVARFERATGMAATEGRALTYDAVQVLADAVRRAGSTEAARVRDALAVTSKLAMVSGSVTFDAERNVNKGVVMLHYTGAEPTYMMAIAP